MATTLSTDLIRRRRSAVEEAHRAFERRYPGDAGERQPVHTVYGGGHLFKADLAAKLGAVARRVLDAYAPDAATLAEAVDLAPPELAAAVYERVVEKLEREPVEDFRIDFEDGYGHRPDAEEDGHAAAAAREVARGMGEGTLPPSIGIRIKPFSAELTDRSLRTLDLFLTTLVGETGGELPGGFVVTLPKVTAPEQVALLADLFDHLEERLDLAAKSLRLEIMIETPQSIFNHRGEVAIPHLVAAGGRRCIAAHFGTYDYTALLEVTAAYQDMAHFSCDFAKQMMKVALAGTGVWISDGSTNVLPVPPHRGEELTAGRKENRRVVHHAWRLHYRHVRHSLAHAFYQGWDLHPAQLPTRYAAVFAFFLESIDAAAARLSNFVAKAAQATLVGDVFDDAATGQGLLNYFLRAINCGAVSEEEARERTGLTLAELHSRSFARILDGRRGAG